MTKQDLLNNDRPLREIGLNDEGLLTIRDGEGFDDIVLEKGVVAEGTPGTLRIKIKDKS